MTDLSFLFQKPQAQGVGAGYEAGMQDYYKQQELANQQAYADQARFQTKRGEALLPTDIAKAKWETNPEVQRAGLEHTQAQTGLYSAQAQEALQKMTTQDMANMHQGVVSLVTQGVQMALRGANGKEIVNSLEAELIQKMQNANGQAKVGYENQLRKLRGDAASSGMLDWSPQEVVTNGTNFLKKMSEYSPERMLQDAKYASILQGQKVIAGAKTAHDQQYEDFIKSYMLDHPTATRNEAHQAWNTSRYGSVQSIGIDPETGMVRKTETSPEPDAPYPKGAVRRIQ